RTTKEGLDILKSHLAIVIDPSLENMVFSFIDQGLSAPKSLIAAINNLTASLDALDDDITRERAADVSDSGKRILRKLLAMEEPAFPDEDIIICADNIEPSVMAGFSEEHVKAVFLANPSETSHTAIIAKSKDFITITGFDSSKYRFVENDTIIVDTFQNSIIIDPTTSDIIDFNKKRKSWNAKRSSILSRAALPAISTDGHEYTISANISSPQGIDKAVTNGCNGVGLFRSEFLFMESKKLPSEDEQFHAYKNVATKTNGELCVIRTLDIGGDKKCACINLPREDNPYLGFRGVRVSLENKSIFKTQLRAILRASAFGKLAIMTPMITTVYEIKRCKRLLAECKKELDNKCIDYDKNIQFGIMIETPAACFMADIFARNVDFFSIGTNDLIQYTFAADRNNPAVAHFFDCYEPAVIHAIHNVVTAAHKADIWVGICGEVASNPVMLPFFMALEVDELSMTSSTIPAIKEQIRNTPSDLCDIPTILSLDSTKKVQNYLNSLAKAD
ncbi:MAG: phosphoenolpyruvate--protein phosphotransferase, partial [Lachnospiraceae bacterium]|nr:phosphoenolpyruvate--protein phosphotransferase [Lachnospiraceae bacterium]